MTTAHRSSITAIAGVDGFRHLALGDVGSTNSEALSLAKDGDNGRLWVTGTTQSAGPWLYGVGVGRRCKSTALLPKHWSRVLRHFRFV